MSSLSVRISSRRNSESNEEYFEGTVSIAGLRPTKLAKKGDGSTQFPNRSSITQASRNLAKSLGYTDISLDEPKSTRKTKSSSQVPAVTV